MKNSVLLLIVLLLTYSLDIEAQQCRPSGQIRGRKHYTTYKCSPQVIGHTKAFLTLNSFEAGGDGGGPSECDK